MNANINNFVSLALLDELSSALAANVQHLVGTEYTRLFRGVLHADAHPSYPLATVLSCVGYTCTEVPITDECSLAEVLNTVRSHFEVVDSCAESDRVFVLDVLEHCFALASRAVLAALAEAKAGFPVSNGSYAAWKAARMQHFVDS